MPKRKSREGCKYLHRLHYSAARQFAAHPSLDTLDALLGWELSLGTFHLSPLIYLCNQ